MPEFIAEDPVHVVIASAKEAIHDVQGRQIAPKQRRVFAKFQRGGAPSYAIKVALETFGFRKIHQGIERERWFGYYNLRAATDEHGWTADEESLIVQRLRELGYLEVAPVRLKAPVPSYDKIKVHGQKKIEHVVAQVLELVESTGIPAAEFVAYERQELDRAEVIAALVALDGDPEPEPEELIAA